MDVISVVGFLESLFPFFPLGNLLGGEQFLSAWSVLLLMLLSVGFGYRLMAKTKLINQGLHAAVEKPTADYLADHPFLKREWADYQRGFVNTAEGLSKTHQPASTYFNEYNVLSHNLTLRFWYSFPNYLVGLGILGTFVGLTFGISGINTSDTTQMREGINTLLSGMGLAFVTSIWGMLLSIVFNIFEKTRFSAVNKTLSKLCFALDERYQMTQQEKINLELQQRQENQTWWDQQLQQQLLHQFSHEDSGGNTILSGVVLRELLKESQQQTRALKSFSSDLADGIMLSSQTVETMGQQFAKMLEEPFQTQFTPAIVKIEEAVNKLREAKEESSNKLIEETLNNFKQQMQQATSSFQDSLSNSAQDSFERLAATIDTAGRSLSGFPAQMEKMLLNMQEQTDQVQQHLQTMAQQLLIMSQKNQDQIQTQIAETIEQLKYSVISMQQETVNTVEQLKGAVSEMQNGTSQLMNQQNTQYQKNQDQIQSQTAETIEQLKLSLMSMQQEAIHTVGQLKDAVSEMQNGTSQFMHEQNTQSQKNQNQIQSQTAETIEQLKHSVISMQQETSNTVEQLKIAVSEMQSGTNQLMNEQNTQSQTLQQQWSKVGDELMQATRKNSEQLVLETQRVMENIQGVIGGLQENMKNLILTQAQEAQNSQRLLEESRQVIQESQQFISEVKKSLLQLSENHQHLSDVSQKLLSTGDHMEASSGQLASMGQSFKEQVRDFLEGNQESLEKLEQALTKARETETLYGERFALIQNGLSGIFSEVEKGLNSYQSTTREQLNRSLADFSENLSQAAKHLSGAVEELAEVVEETQELRTHS